MYPVMNSHPEKRSCGIQITCVGGHAGQEKFQKIAIARLSGGVRSAEF